MTNIRKNHKTVSSLTSMHSKRYKVPHGNQYSKSAASIKYIRITTTIPYDYYVWMKKRKLRFSEVIKKGIVTYKLEGME